jgi:hypothetical protein
MTIMLDISLLNDVAFFSCFVLSLVFSTRFFFFLLNLMINN